MWLLTKSCCQMSSNLGLKLYSHFETHKALYCCNVFNYSAAKMVYVRIEFKCLKTFAHLQTYRTLQYCIVIFRSGNEIFAFLSIKPNGSKVHLHHLTPLTRSLISVFSTKAFAGLQQIYRFFNLRSWKTGEYTHNIFFHRRRLDPNIVCREITVHFF